MVSATHRQLQGPPVENEYVATIGLRVVVLMRCGQGKGGRTEGSCFFRLRAPVLNLPHIVVALHSARMQRANLRHRSIIDYAY